MGMLKRFILSIFVSVALIGATVTGAAAVTWNVDSFGQLQGASDVDVGGTFYDVSFQDGSCVALFSGCDAASDFTFSTYATANLARIALSNQVFLDVPDGNFDSDPSLTNGLSSTGHIITPYTLSVSWPGYVVGTSFLNDIIEASDSISPSFFFGTSLNAGNYGDRTYAVWTVSSVPLPAALPLYGAGLAIMGFFAWKRKRSKA